MYYQVPEKEKKKEKKSKYLILCIGNSIAFEWKETKLSNINK